MKGYLQHIKLQKAEESNMSYGVKKTVIFVVFLLCFLVISCEGGFLGLFGRIPEDYWGTWIQMDTGDEFYIDDSKVYKIHYKNDGDYSTTEIQDGINGYTLESDEVLKNDSTVFFRKGGKNRPFSVSFSGFSVDDGSRSASIGNQVITGKRTNSHNASDTETATSEQGDYINFVGGVAGDKQEVTVSQGKTTTTVELDPQFSGENMGTIPLVEKGTYGFKTTYTINSDAQGFCYGNMYSNYSLTLHIENIGYEICETSVYQISCDDVRLEISGETSGNFSSIEPGKSKDIKLSVRYAELNEEYIDVPVNISIQDSKYGKTWNDNIVLRFYKGLVALKVNSRNFDSKSGATLKGFVIYPDGHSKRFIVAGSETVLIPWSESDYILVFSGASSSNEMAYSFGFSKMTALADISGVWSINEINAYEPNDTTSSAYSVNDLSTPIKAYLKNGDIDFYTINNSSLDIKFNPVNYYGYDWDSSGEFDNQDSSMNPGETISMDICVKNITGSKIESVSAVLSSESEYVTIDTATHTYGEISSGWWKTCSGYSSLDSDRSPRGYYEPSSGFKFTVSQECPVDTIIPFTLTFTDILGNSWTDTFEITVGES